MITRAIATNRTEVEDGATFRPYDITLGAIEPTMTFQAKITGAGMVVKIQGRLSSDLDWYDVATFTSSGMVEVPALPEMRYSIPTAGATLNFLVAGVVRR